MATIEQLQAELQRIQANRPRQIIPGSGGRGQYNRDYANWQRQQFAVNDQIVRARNDAAAASRQAEGDRIQQARDEAYGLARGRVGELRNDPVDQEVLAALRARATGQDVPYNETTTNALFGQRAEMNAQRQRNELDRLNTRGGSVTDPSYQAQLRASQARSDAAMQRARMGVDTQANLVNYDARGQALGQTGAFNQMRNQGITSAENRLLDMLSREEQTQQQPFMPQTVTRTISAGGQSQQQPRQTDMQRYFGQPWSSPKTAPIYGQRTQKPPTSL